MFPEALGVDGEHKRLRFEPQNKNEWVLFFSYFLFSQNTKSILMAHRLFHSTNINEHLLYVRDVSGPRNLEVIKTRSSHQGTV